MSGYHLYIFVLIAILVVGWFAAGTHFNVRKGHKVMAWLQQGLKVVGERTTLRWMGSAVMALKIEDAKTPFRTVEVLAVMEPRDVGPLWWFHHMRGRRDLLIFRAQLRRQASLEFEALQPRGWSTRGVEQQVKFRNWDPVPMPPDSPLVAYSAGGGMAGAELVTAATLPGCPLQRLAVRRREPNLEVHWGLEQAQRVSARELLEKVRDLAAKL